MTNYLSHGLAAGRQADFTAEASRRRLARQAIAAQQPPASPRPYRRLRALRLPFQRPARASA